jgi:uncharacterized protein (TIGR03790 family)
MRILMALLLVLTASMARADLTADQLALVVNSTNPHSRPLAEHYADVRGIDRSRIIDVKIADVVGIDEKMYDTQIAGPIRDELKRRGLEQKVTCLVLFHGMPLRIEAPRLTKQQDAEIRMQLNPLLTSTRIQARKVTGELETFVGQIDPTFRPRTEQDFESVIGRANVAEERGKFAVMKLQAEKRQAAQAELSKRLEAFKTMPQDGSLAASKPARPLTPDEMQKLTDTEDDATARRTLREHAYHTTNVLVFLRLIELQKQSLISAGTEASVDSELSTLWWPAANRRGWRDNPMFHRAKPGAAKLPMPIMISRIDGPTPEIARRIIDHSISVEQTGLQGGVVLDARGIDDRNGQDGYGIYDLSIRNLAKVFADARIEDILFDVRPELLMNDSRQNTAIYCGWYQVRNYAPTCRFVPGAVAFHVASLEMISLRPDAEKGWCRGQLLDGAAVTIGAVGEPYLYAFPRADQFFPLLATGKLTLVETYWATIPITSWKMVLIGDPLYRPFAKAPWLAPEQVPDNLLPVLR